MSKIPVWQIMMAMGCAAGLLTAAGAAPARLGAEEIVARHAAARGGVAAWHAIQAMSWSGKMEVGAGDSTSRSARFVEASLVPHTRRGRAAAQAEQQAAMRKQVQVPFVVDMKRPTMSRVEIEFAGKTAVQVYDGRTGWKVRPYLNRSDAEPFTAEEIKASAGKWDIDGPLIDHLAQGSKVDVEGVDSVEGHDAYRLKITAKSGAVQRIWIDAQSFLDVKIEGSPRFMDGKMHAVWVYQRDFRAEQGVMIPHLLETAVEGYPETHKMTVEKVVVNPALSDALFAKPTAKPTGT